MKTLVIPIFIPHLGCPHTCIFCNQKKIAGVSKAPTKNMLIKKTQEFLNTLKDPKKHYIEIAFYGGSFTAIEDYLQESYLSEANLLIKKGLIDGIRLSTRPDYINEKVIERLIRHEVSTVELGVQSLDEEVLRKSERGHTSESVVKAVALLKKMNIKIGLQLMPGLPSDTREKSLATCRKVIDLKPDMVRIYPTAIIKDTNLAEMYHSGEYTPWSLEETIELVAQMLILFDKEKINVIRIGLQASENLQEDKDLIAGPHHPAMGELVKARLFRKQIEAAFKRMKDLTEKIIIYCYPKELSQVKGQNNENTKFLINEFNVNIKVVPNKELAKGSLLLADYTGNTYLSLREDFLLNYNK